MSKLKQKLQNSIEASKIEINMENLEETQIRIIKQLSLPKLEVIYADITVHHMESLYRDNIHDKYEYMLK